MPRRGLCAVWVGLTWLDGLLKDAAAVNTRSVSGAVYYWSFVVVLIVLLNIAVAILVDSCAADTDHSAHCFALIANRWLAPC